MVPRRNSSDCTSSISLILEKMLLYYIAYKKLTVLRFRTKFWVSESLPIPKLMSQDNSQEDNGPPSSMPSFRESLSSPNRNSQVVAPTSPAVNDSRSSLWLNSLPRQLGQTRTAEPRSGLAYPGASSEPSGLPSQHLTSQRSMISNNSVSRRRRGDINPGRVMQHLLYSSLGSDLPDGAQTPTRLSSAQIDPTSDPTAVQRVIWGTNVDVTEAISMFKDFIANFTMAHKINFMMENSNEMEGNESVITPSDNLPFYDHYLSEVI